MGGSHGYTTWLNLHQAVQLCRSLSGSSVTQAFARHLIVSRRGPRSGSCRASLPRRWASDAWRRTRSIHPATVDGRLTHGRGWSGAGFVPVGRRGGPIGRRGDLIGRRGDPIVSGARPRSFPAVGGCLLSDGTDRRSLPLPCSRGRPARPPHLHTKQGGGGRFVGYRRAILR